MTEQVPFDRWNATRWVVRDHVDMVVRTLRLTIGETTFYYYVRIAVF